MAAWRGHDTNNQHIKRGDMSEKTIDIKRHEKLRFNITFQFTYVRGQHERIRNTLPRIELQNKFKNSNLSFGQLMLDGAHRRQNKPEWNIHFTNFWQTIHPRKMGANRILSYTCFGRNIHLWMSSNLFRNLTSVFVVSSNEKSPSFF